MTNKEIASLTPAQLYEIVVNHDGDDLLAAITLRCLKQNRVMREALEDFCAECCDYDLCKTCKNGNALKECGEIK